MNYDDPKEPQDSSDSGSDQHPNTEPSDSTPNDNVQAPQSGLFKKSLDTPDEDVQSPRSRWLRGGFTPDEPEPDDE